MILGTINVLVDPPRPIPLSSAIVGGVLAFVLMGATRWLWRRLTEHERRPHAAGRTPSSSSVRAPVANRPCVPCCAIPNTPYVPVALLDDDPKKHGLSIQGVRVIGNRADLATASGRYGAATLLIAMPGADSALIRDLLARAEDAGLDVQVLPSVKELLGGNVRVVDIREPNVVDLLGRTRVETDIEAVSRVPHRPAWSSVTGAGGSIGSELCRQVSELGPAELIMIDRDESALHAVQLSIEGRALLDSDDVVLLDIRDRARLARLFEVRRPEVVFHAAALKHLPLLEALPGRGAQDQRVGNPGGARRRGGRRGRSLREHLHRQGRQPVQRARLHQADRRRPHRLPGRGDRSVLPQRPVRQRARQPRLGAHRRSGRRSRPAARSPSPTPTSTRYFMTVEEAVQLVIQAGAIGRGGEVLVLDMGEQVRIADVARQLASSSNPPIRIEYTGLRPGEKLHEELISDFEIGFTSEHPMIHYVDVPPLSPDLVCDIDAAVDDRILVETLQALCDDMAARAGTIGSVRPIDPDHDYIPAS